MSHHERPQEVLLAQAEDNGELRRVSMLVGESLAVIERTSGPVTLVAYGSQDHGHKILCDYDSVARVLQVSADEVPDALVRLFGNGPDEVVLSDLMDMLDRAGERYTYTAWSSEGDAVMRA